jgi:Transposase DDE domain
VRAGSQARRRVPAGRATAARKRRPLGPKSSARGCWTPWRARSPWGDQPRGELAIDLRSTIAIGRRRPGRNDLVELETIATAGESGEVSGKGALVRSPFSSLYVAPLLDAVRARGFRPETCAMDKGYATTLASTPSARSATASRSSRSGPRRTPDNSGHRSRRTVAAVPRIPRHTQRWRDLYRNRAAVEREFARLKNEYALAPLRVRRLERVALHTELTTLTRLSQALARVRQKPAARSRLASSRISMEVGCSPPQAAACSFV